MVFSSCFPVFPGCYPRNCVEIFLKQKWRLKMSMKSQNTKRVAQVLPVLKDDFVVWDDLLSQLGRRVRKSRETWIVQTRVEGKTKRRTLGACCEIKVEAARVLAQAYLDELTNPNAVAQGDTTLAEFAERFLAQSTASGAAFEAALACLRTSGSMTCATPTPPTLSSQGKACQSRGVFLGIRALAAPAATPIWMAALWPRPQIVLRRKSRK